MTALIAGAGIGGLALALALKQRGIDFIASTRRAESKPLWVGINILPHAAGGPAEFGILDSIEAGSVKNS